MSSSQSSQPTFLTVAPRFVVYDMEQTLAFYEQLGFQTTITTKILPSSNGTGWICI
jgi:hypothetical protein